MAVPGNPTMARPSLSSAGGEKARNIMRILLIQGANMNWLGRREPELYGTTSAMDLEKMLIRHAQRAGHSLKVFQTNIEGEAINRIYRATEEAGDGLLMNPAGFTYAGYALRDCLKAVRLPYVEVHMTNLEKRGVHSVTASVADGFIAGMGVTSYFVGFDGLVEIISRRAHTPSAADAE
jgi:3-dehydroquinate dehydratase-2